MSELLERARAEGTPFIDGETVTFVWQGDPPPALIGDFAGWEDNPVPLEPAGAGLWTHNEKISRDAYIEYAFYDPVREVRVPDPFNPRTCPNGMGDTNHFFFMPGAEITPLTRRKRGVPKGEVTRYLTPTLGFAASGRREVHLYRPPVDGPTRLLVVFDGQDYLPRGRLPQILDNLIYQKRIRPISLALVSHGKQARVVEYACSDATSGLLTEIVLPLARKELDLVDPVSGQGGYGYGVMGASMGGLMSLYAGLRLPELFSSVLAQSGAYGDSEKEFIVEDLVRYLPRRPIKIWMDVGKYEFLLEANRRMLDLLKRRGYAPCYREYPGGHNYTSWRNDLWRGLEFLFPPG